MENAQLGRFWNAFQVWWRAALQHLRGLLVEQPEPVAVPVTLAAPRRRRR